MVFDRAVQLLHYSGKLGFLEMDDLLDTYSRQARLLPALLVLLPLFVAIAIWVPELYDLASGLLGLATACGAVVYLAHLSRALGRKVEPHLYSNWGGKPTTLWLSHDDPNLDALTKARYHAFLRDHIDGWVPPSFEEESRDFHASEIAYESAVRWLREKTRNRKRYALIFKENVSYGFRRNLYGLKPVGLSLGLLCLAGNSSAFYHSFFVTTSAIRPDGLASLVFNLFVVAGWLAVVRQSWVKDGADGYARALLAACDQISSDGES